MRVKRNNPEANRVVYGDAVTGKETVHSIVLNTYNTKALVNAVQKVGTDNYTSIYKYQNHSIKFDYVRYGGRMGSNARRVFHSKANIAGMILNSNGYLDRLISDFEDAFAPDGKDEHYSIPVVVIAENKSRYDLDEEQEEDDTKQNTLTEQLNEKLSKYSNWQIFYTQDANDSKVSKDALDYILSFQ